MSLPSLPSTSPSPSLPPTEQALQAAYGLWCRARDPHDRDRALQQIELAARPVIRGEIRRYFGYDAGDLQQIARIALWRAIERYDPSVPRARLAGYIRMCVTSALRHHTLYNNQILRVCSGVILRGEQRIACVSTEEIQGPEIGHLRSEDDVERQVTDALGLPVLLEQMLGCCSPRQAECLRLRIGEGLDYAEIAQILGLNVKQVDNGICMGLENIRKRYGTVARAAGYLGVFETLGELHGD